MNSKQRIAASIALVSAVGVGAVFTTGEDNAPKSVVAEVVKAKPKADKVRPGATGRVTIEVPAKAPLTSAVSVPEGFKVQNWRRAGDKIIVIARNVTDEDLELTANVSVAKRAKPAKPTTPPRSPHVRPDPRTIDAGTPSSEDAGE